MSGMQRLSEKVEIKEAHVSCLLADKRERTYVRVWRRTMKKNQEDYLQKVFEIAEIDLRTYSPLTLAYIGDAVFDLIVRTVLVERKNCQAQKHHKSASSIVKAPTQAAMAEYLIAKGCLDEEELAVYRRGRNAFTHTRAKNATMSEYRKATGYEALMGYLYLKKETERMIDLIKEGLEGIGKSI